MSAIPTPTPTQPKHPSRPLRLIRTLTLATLLGVTLTIATTWAQALLLKPKTWPPGTELVGQNLGWPWPPPDGWPDGANCVQECFDGAFLHSNTPREDRIPPDGHATWIFPKPPSNEPVAYLDATYNFSHDYMMEEHRYGWPIAAMHRVPEIMGLEHFLPNAMAHPHDLNTLSHRLRNGLKLHPNWPEVPLAPVWPGFALHTIFWAALTLATHHVLTTLRTLRRQRLGECAKCRYPIQGLPRCPECGTPTQLASPL